MECRSRSWIAAISAGIIVFLTVAIFGEGGFLAGVLLGSVTAGLLGALLVWAVCTGAGSPAENAAFMEADWTPQPFEPARRVIAAGGTVISARPMPDSTPVDEAPARETVTLTPEVGSSVAAAITEGPPATLPEPEPDPAPPPPMALAGLNAAMGVPPLAVMNDPLLTDTVARSDEDFKSHEVAGVDEMPVVENVPQQEPESETAAMAMESTGAASPSADAEAGAEPDNPDGGITPLPSGDLGGRAPGAGEASGGQRSADDSEVTRIEGVSPMLATWLAEQGISRLDQIAAWDQADIARYAGMMGNNGHRIRSEDWVGQARTLIGLPHGGGDPVA